MFSLKIRYALYGMILSASLITLVAQAGTEDGVFGDYFYRMIGVCPTNKEIVTGFDPNTGQYGARVCTKITTILGKIGINVDDATGNIGIGVDPSDTKKLTVNGDLDIVGTLKISPPVSYDDAVDRTTLDAGLVDLCSKIGVWNYTFRKCDITPTYSWQIESYGACSATCGGTKTAVVVCRDNTGKTVEESECLGVKPTHTVSCSDTTCTDVKSCAAIKPTCATTDYTCTLKTGTPTEVGQAWKPGAPNCGYTCESGLTGDNCADTVLKCTGTVPSSNVITSNTINLTEKTDWQSIISTDKCYYKCTDGFEGPDCNIPTTNKCTLPATLACELEL